LFFLARRSHALRERESNARGEPDRMLRRRCQFSLPTKRDESVFFVFSVQDRHLSSESMKSDSLGQLILTGVPGTRLDAAAEKLFRRIQPGGFILSLATSRTRRNCAN